MIRVQVHRNKSVNGEESSCIYGFTVDNHGDTFVCAAVSALTLNTVNSIEAFCGDEIHCEYDEGGGYLRFVLPALERGGQSSDASLLLNALLLGLTGIEAEHPEQIRIQDKI